MTDPSIIFYESLKPHFDAQLNGAGDFEKSLRKSILDQSPERIVEIIKNVEAFIKQQPGVLKFKKEMWEDLIRGSTSKTSDGEYIHEVSANKKIRFKTWPELVSYLNKNVAPFVMEPFDQALARILVEYYVRTIVDGFSGIEKAKQIDFLKKSLRAISEKDELSKYLKAQLSEHLNYYKQVLEIQRKDFDNILFFNLTGEDRIRRLRMALESETFSDFIDILRPIFASIPHQINVNNEKYYHSIFFVVLQLLGFDILAEVSTNLGRIDAVIEFPNIIYILEFKMDEAETAIQQIKDRRYHEKYQDRSKKIVLAGVAFNRNQKNIGEYILELA
ncbi:MAG: PD-(D/E)XK nuclease domain-containing protein [Cyclobacteriaceae bacterium]